MIFKAVNKLTTKSEKNFFIEQVQVYRRLVEVFCEKNGMKLKAEKNQKYEDELMNIGVINSGEDSDELKKILKEKYSKFEEAVNFVIENRGRIGSLVDKLYNSKRTELQKKSAEINKLTLVDFFCGAGGLSLGFLQEGFNVKLANDIEDVCIQTYKYNHPELPSNKLIQGDIKEIVDNIDDYIDGNIDIVVGGPPCQGFSEANRQRVIDDPRNKLYKYSYKVKYQVLN